MPPASLAAFSQFKEVEAVCPFCANPLQPKLNGQLYHTTRCMVKQTERHENSVRNEVSIVKSVMPTAPPEKTKDRAMAAMRSLVSQKKVRFQQDGFDLDLTYITPKIIAMGFPSSGREAYYRNPVAEVEKFFEARHKGRFRIYNLCSEREYEGADRFGGRFKRFPFDDHNAPCPIKLIPDLCRDVHQFLLEDDENVVAIHCKAGKGRTGLMISCLLMLLDPSLRKPYDALTFFGEVRTADGKGVTIPSQKRYVTYWDAMLRDHGGREPPLRTVLLETLRVHSLIRPSGAPEVYFHIYEKGKLRLDSKKVFPNSKAQMKNDGFDYDFASSPQLSSSSGGGLQLNGDIKFVFYQQNRLLKDEELFHFWLNTSLCSEMETLTKANLDKACKDKKHAEICANLAVTVTFRMLATASHAGGAAQGEGGDSKGKGIFGRLFK